ncbi:KH domain-containing protein [Candidatus Beckwithbacteria bacterium]|nr:KH domain-containing protein [Candidatus Beckwithbacteria bacterium]
MEKLLRFILENIVDHPEDIKIQTKESEYGYNLIEFEVNPEDMGRIIGKGGKIISSIRKIIKIKAMKLGKRVNINLLEPEA